MLVLLTIRSTICLIRYLLLFGVINISGLSLNLKLAAAEFFV
jgi:hypothetical protein